VADDALDQHIAAAPELGPAAAVRLAFDVRELVGATADLAASMARVLQLAPGVSLDDGLIDVLVDVDVQRAHVQLHWDGVLLLLRANGLWEMDDLVLSPAPTE
jgi:hypothetical protein